MKQNAESRKQMVIRGKRIIFLLSILLLSGFWTAAQKKIVLNTPKMQYVETQLYDDDNNYVLTLPLTFNLNKNILAIMVGGEGVLLNNQSVCFFSEELPINKFLKNAQNISATKTFIKNNPELNSILLPNRKASLYRKFDDGYEIVKKNAKPLFLEIKGTTTLYLQFYVAKTDKKYPTLLYAKCKPVEIELITK